MSEEHHRHEKARYISAEVLRNLFSPPPSLRTIRSWTAARIIPSVRIGGKVYYDHVAVTAKIENSLTVRDKVGRRGDA